MKIRYANKSDAKSIAQINVKTWRKVYEGKISGSYLSNLSVSDKCSKWEKSINYNPSGVLVIEIDGIVRGYSSFGESIEDSDNEITGEIYSIYLDYKFINKGLGTLLEKKIVKELKERQFTKVTLWVLESNKDARKFYEAHGWKVDGEKKIERRGGMQLHEVRYYKEL